MKHLIKPILLGILVLQVTSMVAQEIHPKLPSDGLVAWYPFNGNANDESGNGNHGVMNGGLMVTTDRFGVPGRAFRFDGSSAFINIPTLNAQAYRPITYATWVKIGAYFPSSPGHKFRSIIGRHQFGQPNDGMLGFFADQNVASGAYDNTFLMWRGGGAEPAPSSLTVPALDTWVHIAYTQDESGNFAFYQNGTLVNSGNFVNTQDLTTNFRIGSGNSPDHYFWNGDLDDIGIWNRPLLSGEVLELYTAGMLQAISFSPLTDILETAGPISLVSTASSGLPVVYTSTDTDKITLSGNQATIVGPGSVTIHADQPGDINYEAAPRVSQTICILPKKPTIFASGLGTVQPILASSSSLGNQWYRNGELIGESSEHIILIDDVGQYTVKVTVDNCVSEFSDPFAIIITNLSLTEKGGLRVYPNPTRHELMLDLRCFSQGETGVARIYDLSGRTVIVSKVTNGESRISVNHLTPASYVVGLFAGSVCVGITKFIKE